MIHLLIVSVLLAQGRFESFTEKAAKGPKMTPVAATYFGGEGLEEFIAARTLPDSTIVAFGNAWGPEFPGTPTVLGKGMHRHLKGGIADAKGKVSYPSQNPDIAGFIVFYSADLGQVKKVLRFDWGVASLSAACLSADSKAFILAGRATPAFHSIARKTQKHQVPEGKDFGPYEYEGTPVTGDVFVARLSLDGTMEWTWIFEGVRNPPSELWTDQAGQTYVDVRGLNRISADGATSVLMSTLTAGRQARWFGVDPKDGAGFYGGDRNTHTGKEPWRQPFLYRIDAKGEKEWALWEWAPKSLRDGVTPGVQGEVSDSSPRALDVGKDGALWVGGWSDGGNSLFVKQPTDATKRVPEAKFGMDCSGMKGANSLAHLMKIDGKTKEAELHAWWVAYFPGNFVDAKKKNSPNGARIRQVKELAEGKGVAIAGSAASVLVQTPNSFYNYPGDGSGYGGECVVVYDAECSSLLFSSYLPGCENLSIWPTQKGLVVVSRSRGSDGAKEPTASPVLHAVQPEHHGELDAHILLLELP